MLQRHSNCENIHCRVCLEDHTALQDVVEKATGITREDWLGKYHYWLKNEKSIDPETEHGWGTSAWFDDDLIAEFIATVRAGLKETT